MLDKIEDWFYDRFSKNCEITNIFIHPETLEEGKVLPLKATIDYEINGKEKFIEYTETL